VCYTRQNKILALHYKAMARNGGYPIYYGEDRFLTNVHCKYRQPAAKPFYNLLNNARYDRNWGRSVWSCPAVQLGWPYNIVDEQHNYQAGFLEPFGEPATRLPWDPQDIQGYYHVVPQDVMSDASWNVLNRLL